MIISSDDSSNNAKPQSLPMVSSTRAYWKSLEAFNENTGSIPSFGRALDAGATGRVHESDVTAQQVDNGPQIGIPPSGHPLSKR